jgi:2,3-bisphosphoglycerate-dependent phosphoglycerate mutase
MTNIYFIRHAEYLYDRVDGQGPKQNLGLTPEGRANAERLGARLSATGEIRPDVFISSTERGALETAEIVAPALGRPILQDRDFEEWRSEDGTVPTDAFMEAWRGLGERDRPYHRFVEGCETGIEFSTRVHSALHRLVSQHTGSIVVLMTHGGVIQVAFQYFFGYGDAAFRRAYPAAAPTSITHWRQDGASGRWILEKSNDRGHLG